MNLASKLLMCCNNQLTFPSNGLIASYQLISDGSDTLGNYNLTNSGVTFPNGAALFNSTSDVLYNTEFSSDVYAISFWMKPTSTITNTSASGCIIDLNDTSGEIPSAGLFTGNWTTFGTDETFTISSLVDSVQGRTYIRDSISDDWHHVIINWDSNILRYRIYVDLIEPTTYAGTSGNAAFMSELEVGQIRLGRNGVDGFPYYGELKHFHFYNRYLTNQEMNLINLIEK